MRFQRPGRVLAFGACVLIPAGVVGLVGGCAAQLNDPFTDNAAAAREEFTTPSARAFGHAGPAAADRRPGETVGLRTYAAGVTHWPIWWEDPFLDLGNDRRPPDQRDAADATFAVNGADLLAGPYCVARFAVNTALWPISAVVTPPGTVMTSDGRLSRGLSGYQHDAARASPDAEGPEHVARDRPMLAPLPADAAAPPGAAPPDVPSSTASTASG